MAKIKLFDELSWSQFSEAELNNKACGAIGTLIPNVRNIHYRLNERLVLGQTSDTKSPAKTEYVCAVKLREQNPKAFACMAISFEQISNSEFHDALKDCTEILRIWKEADSQDKKHLVWRDAFHYLKRIKKIIDNGRAFFEKLEFADLPKVKGNAAWQAYLSLYLTDSGYRNLYDLQKKYQDRINEKVDELKELLERADNNDLDIGYEHAHHDDEYEEDDEGYLG